ncbi:hypothetical protein L228DRAFT_168833 [Xylona heveae TC161]|uniref:Uncharacterized protein n=1 Tax=Xylona heveae (strain CBS 132557 / TC161) TaxID=1328760 RepID=A0A165FQ50_XYLHT|nr:hypothetical protein L228DRAFT_168833 [Xylona heveae TC161]KZF21244.1 hypothetical protein L228DRAFT_168833 [Xylona heveae TC161]
MLFPVTERISTNARLFQEIHGMIWYEGRIRLIAVQEQLYLTCCDSQGSICGYGTRSPQMGCLQRDACDHRHTILTSTLYSHCCIHSCTLFTKVHLSLLHFLVDWKWTGKEIVLRHGAVLLIVPLTGSWTRSTTLIDIPEMTFPNEPLSPRYIYMRYVGFSRCSG